MLNSKLDTTSLPGPLPNPSEGVGRSESDRGHRSSAYKGDDSGPSDVVSRSRGHGTDHAVEVPDRSAGIFE